MSTAVGTTESPVTGGEGEVIISADSHVMEPHNLWVERMPKALKEQAPTFQPPKLGDGFQGHPGGHDPHARLQEMAVDGVSAEVLYPTLGLTLFGLDDARIQETAFRLYNDWLIEYCQVGREQLVGIPCIATYDIDHAIAELERCTKAGLKGALIWQVPHPDLPFPADHYNRFWDAAQALEAPVSLHILTGHNYSRNLFNLAGPEMYRASVNLKLLDVANAAVDFIFHGILERYPRLKIVLVENEIGWIPFMLQQWDYYYRRFHGSPDPKSALPIDRPPSDYFNRQVYATFFNDPVGTRSLGLWGQDNCMWSNDFPHPNSTWPNSRKVIERDLGYLPLAARAKLVRENVTGLYALRIPQAVGPR